MTTDRKLIDEYEIKAAKALAIYLHINYERNSDLLREVITKVGSSRVIDMKIEYERTLAGNILNRMNNA